MNDFALVRSREVALPRPLRIGRALLIVIVAGELLDRLLMPGPIPILFHTLSIVSAVAVTITLFRPLIGVLVAIVPISSALLLDRFGQDFLPLVVTSVVVCATGAVRLTLITMAGYLGYCCAWLFTAEGPHRALAYLALLAIAATVGFVARGVWWQISRVQRRIHQIQADTVRLRAAERAALADELSTLLVDGLADQQRELTKARSASEVGILAGALVGADARARETLAQLRGLVSTLRGRDGDTAAFDGADPGNLIRIAEEVEEVLAGHGHATELELPPDSHGTGNFARQVLGTILREAGNLMVAQAPPGAVCTIEVMHAPHWVGIEVGHPGSVVPVRPSATLRTAQERVLAADGSFDSSSTDDSWRLRATVPVLANGAGADSSEGRRQPTTKSGTRVETVLRWTSAFGALLIATLVGVRAGSAWSVGDHGWTWWALWALTWIGLALALWRFRYSVPILVGVIVLSLWGTEPTLAMSQPNQLAMVAVTAIGVVRDSRWAWVATALWTIYGMVWFDAPSLWLLSAGLVYPVIGVLVGLAGQYVQRMRTTQSRQLVSVATSHDEARDEVRRELAGELHDIVAHQLSLITMQASGHRDDIDPATLRTALDRVSTINRSAQADLALLLQVMRTTPATQPTTAEVGWLTPTVAVQAAAATMREAGYPIRVEVDPDIERADPTTRKTLTRVVREATTNILRYAPPGGDCEVTIVIEQDEIELAITNPLPAVPRRSEHSTGLGLVGLEERVRITGGTFTAGPLAGRWRLAARLPLTSAVDLRPRPEDRQASI